MKKFLFIFIFILFFTPNVFASNTNVSSKISYTYGGVKGTYEGDEIYLGGYNGRFTVGTRYNGRLGELSFYLSANDYNFTTNHTYTITLNMATEDWRNHFMGPQVIKANSSGTLGSSLSVSNFRFVSYKQIKFNFKTDGSLPVYFFFRLYSTDYANPNGGNTAITGTNNWNLSSIYINNNVSPTPTPAPVTPAPTPTPQPSNKDIIDNAKQNTQDIIDNQNNNTNNLIENNNQNTTDVIENNNQNTENIIDNQNQLFGNRCSNLLSKENLINGYYSIGSGAFGSSNDATATINKLEIDNKKNYVLSVGESSEPFTIYIMFYDSSENYLGNISTTSNRSLFTSSFSSYSSAKYVNFRFDISRTNLLNPMFNEGSSKKPYCEYNSYSSKIDDLNETIKDDNIDDKTSFFTDFDDNDHGLTSIITIPLNTIQQLTNTSCVSLTVPIPFTNRNISLPCMTEIYQNTIPSIFNIWQIVSFGIIAYFICLDIFKMVKGFKDPNEDKVEVLDL